MKCKICQSEIKQDLKLKNARKFYFCDHCDFVFLADEFLLSSEQEKARYDQHQNLESNQVYMQILDEFYEQAVKPYSQAGTLLDYGSGPRPVFAEMLKAKGIEVDIYDVFYAPDLPAKTYEMISSIETWEHFYNPMESIQTIVSLLKSSAYMSVMTEFRPSYEEFGAWRYKDDTTHVSFYSTKTFKFIAETFALDLVKSNAKNIAVLKSKQ